MTLFQKVSNWLFGTPPIPTSTITKAPEVARAPVPDPVAPAPEPVAPAPAPEPVQNVTVSATEAVKPSLPREENTLTLDVPSEWPFTNTVKVDPTPAAMTATKKPRKPRSKKK